MIGVCKTDNMLALVCAHGPLHVHAQSHHCRDGLEHDVALSSDHGGVLSQYFCRLVKIGGVVLICIGKQHTCGCCVQ